MVRIILALLLFPSVCSGWGTFPMQMDSIASGGADPYPDIVFYSNCDTVNLGGTVMAQKYPNTTAGTITFTSSGITSEIATAPQVGNVWDNAGAKYQRVRIPVTDNYDPNNARLGWWWRPMAGNVNGSDGDYIFWADGATSDIKIKMSTATELMFGWGNQYEIVAHGVTLDGTQAAFIEIEMNGNDAIMYIDGTPVSSLPGASIVPDATEFSLGGNAKYHNAEDDQLFISNDHTRDLNAIKTITTISN